MIDDDDIDPVGRSRRSVGHTGGVITSRSGGMSDVLLSGAQLITQQRFHVSGCALGLLVREETGWNISREKCTHLTG